jgi:hypothetical protein
MQQVAAGLQQALRLEQGPRSLQAWQQQLLTTAPASEHTPAEATLAA